MNINAAADKIKKSAALLRMAAYLLAVVSVCSAVSILCAVNAPAAPSPYNGTVDLTGLDFNKEIVTIINTSFTMYPGAFYLPEDFAAGKVTQEGIPYNTPGVQMSDFGTLRILLALPPGEAYAIAGKNVSYAQRLFIDGKEHPSIGVTGDSIEDVTPKTTRFMEGFAPTDNTTEIVIHYSAFVYGDGGGLYPFEIGLVRNVARNEQLRVFRITALTAALITAVLFFFGLFLFFPKGRYLLWFALICLCVALRGLLISDKFIMLLLPDLDWYLAIRLEFILTCGMALFAALYLNGLFSRAVNRWVIRGFAVFCVSSMAFLCLTQPVVFSRFTGAFTLVYAAFLTFLVLAVLIAALRKKLTSPLSGAEQSLLLFGLIVYTLFAVLGIYAHKNSLTLWGLDYPQVGMMVFLFINMLALVLGFARTERELDEARHSEREMEEINRTLERLNRVRAAFLANFTHEMKTPLAGIDALAQYTRALIRGGMTDRETDENLSDISQRAVWLAGQVDRLLEQSLEQEEKLSFAAVSIGALFHQASEEMTPLLAERGNCLVTEANEALPPLSGSAELLLRVLRNLIGNANHHSKGGVILLTAKAAGSMAEIRVADHGLGIPSKILHSIFRRGVSGNGSSGLGLSICKEDVETHGGTINIKSAEGNGTEVWFTIPFVKEEAL